MTFVLGLIGYIIYSFLTVGFGTYFRHKNYSYDTTDVRTKISKYLKYFGYFSYYLMIFGYVLKNVKKGWTNKNV